MVDADAVAIEIDDMDSGSSARIIRDREENSHRDVKSQRDEHRYS